MGSVHLAEDVALGRRVAIKLVRERLSAGSEGKARFLREARALASVEHSGNVRLYTFGEAEGRPYFVMEFVEGETLASRLAREGRLSLHDAVAILLQIVDALEAAWEKGVVHRDVKPSNILLDTKGRVRVADFGLAKSVLGSGDGGISLTGGGHLVGTPAYLAPEQAHGRHVDFRADVYSLGCVLYEMLTGSPPFQGPSSLAVVDQHLHADFPSLGGKRPDLPSSVSRLVEEMTRRESAERPSYVEIRSRISSVEADAAPPTVVAGERPVELERSSPGTARPGPPASRRISRWLALAKAPFALLGRLPGVVRSRRLQAALVAAGLLAAAFLGRSWYRASRLHWARDVATREVRRLVAAEEYAPAVALARRAIEVLPGDPELKALLFDATIDASVQSDPPGAEVSYRPYRGDPAVWERVGVTPFQKVPVPRGWYVWRATRPGFTTGYVIAPTWISAFRYPLALRFRLDPEGSLPADLVRVPGGATALPFPGLEHLPPVTLEDYLIGRCEVTNEEFKRFVDAGGYAAREHWKEPFTRDGRSVRWDEAMTVFRDTTGRPGPSTWELGTFPKGEERHPASGISWYEAAAYAAFAGRTLPTIYHWSRAAQATASHLVAPGSNFQGSGTVPVGGVTALSGYGTYDMAGNVKEWCWNEGAGGKRYISGGGFGEPDYMFIDPDTQSPWDRRPNYGFRTVQLGGPPPPAAAATAEGVQRDFSTEKPASDEVFRAFRGLYAYDRGDLDVRVEETSTTEDGTVQRVSFRAAYGNERVIARLFLPKGVAPPYQVVVYFPASRAIYMDGFALDPLVDFLPRSGRALLVPTYKGTFERRDDLKNDIPNETASYRDHMIAWSKDLGRSLDYLATRADVDRARMAFVGLSWGVGVAPVLVALESRFRVAIFQAGGLPLQRALPEAEPLHFAPRVTVPVLMLNGRYDHMFPLETSQLPLLRLLGTPEADKKYVIYETGHVPPRKEVIRESLDWLPRYLGPVNREPGR
jgi:eukaryotic-like serine/threonine-protein kinase